MSSAMKTSMIFNVSIVLNFFWAMHASMNSLWDTAPSWFSSISWNAESGQLEHVSHKSTLGATCLDKHLLAGLICICLVDQQKKILDYLLKLLTQNVGVKIWSNSTHFQCYRPVVINVEDAEYLLQVFLWGSFGLKTGILVMSSPGDPLDMM